MTTRRVTRSMTRVANQSPLIDLNQVDIESDIEFLTLKQCKRRRLTNDIFNKDGKKVLGRYVYLKKDRINPVYLKNLSPEQLSNPNLLAVAPHGFLWEEDHSITSDYSWSGYHRLVKNPYTQSQVAPKPVVKKPQVAPKPVVEFASPKVYIEPGVEFLTYEECKNRGLSNDIFDKEGRNVLGLFVYRGSRMVHPIYRTILTPEQREATDLFAVAPHGFLWEEEPSGTSYYSWDEYYKLVKNPYI